MASRLGRPFIDDCLASFEVEARALGAEVIVVTAGDGTEARRLERRFPSAKVISGGPHLGIPALRRQGLEAARGEIVAIIEERCLAGEHWLHHALDGHRRGRYGAVGGPVADHGYKRLGDWAVYFCEYHRSMPPVPYGEVTELNGANIAYRRQAVLDHRELLAESYWEASLHPRLLAEGMKLLSLPDMVVHKRGPFDLGEYLRQRYWFSRAYAGFQRRSVPASRRYTYLALAPLIPAVLLMRMTRRVVIKRRFLGKYLQATPFLIPALAAYVAGELVGYLRGPGDALSRVR